MDVSRWIEYRSGWAPDKTALRFEGRTTSYAELEAAVARAAGWLLAKGIARGDRVAYLGPNCPELLEIFFACARVGAIFVPLNARMPAPELNALLELADPALLVAEKQLMRSLDALVMEDDRIEMFVIGADALSGPSIPADPDADALTPMLMLFTSGTTGRPKGAVHTNEGLIAGVQDAFAALDVTSSDEILTVLPMFHIAGLAVLTLPALAAGATVTIHRGFDPQAALRDIEQLRATLTVVAPQMAVAIAGVARWDSADVSSLRLLLIGGTTITPEAIRPWQQRGVPVSQGYGMTEIGSVSYVPQAAIPRKTLTAGKPTLHSRFRVIDREGREVAPGEPGELTVRGPTVTRGYWRNPAATDEAIRGGWFHTGDMVFMDDDGFLHIVDRIKEIIIVGTSNVYPADVETVLTASPLIAEAAVVGVPDPELGEVPFAFVVLEQGASMDEDEALLLFKGRLADYKHPRRVMFMDALPRTSIGKVEKKALRALAGSARLERV